MAFFRSPCPPGDRPAVTLTFPRTSGCTSTCSSSGMLKVKELPEGNGAHVGRGQGSPVIVPAASCRCDRRGGKRASPTHPEDPGRTATGRSVRFRRPIDRGLDRATVEAQILPDSQTSPASRLAVVKRRSDTVRYKRNIAALGGRARSSAVRSGGTGRWHRDRGSCPRASACRFRNRALLRQSRASAPA